VSADMHLWILWIIVACGAAGGFVNVFIGDSGLHLPKVENDVFQPGFIAVVFVGMAAALASWGSLKAVTLIGADTKPLVLSTSDIANSLLIGFGGAKWWKSEIEKDILRKTAAIAANKKADPTTAATIATATPLNALKAAINMS
jgi:Na+/H+-dicarboxylate symporter